MITEIRSVAYGPDCTKRIFTLYIISYVACHIVERMLADKLAALTGIKFHYPVDLLALEYFLAFLGKFITSGEKPV